MPDEAAALEKNTGNSDSGASVKDELAAMKSKLGLGKQVPLKKRA